MCPLLRCDSPSPFSWRRRHTGAPEIESKRPTRIALLRQRLDARSTRRCATSRIRGSVLPRRRARGHRPGTQRREGRAASAGWPSRVACRRREVRTLCRGGQVGPPSALRAHLTALGAELVDTSIPFHAFGRRRGVRAGPYSRKNARRPRRGSSLESGLARARVSLLRVSLHYCREATRPRETKTES